MIIGYHQIFLFNSILDPIDGTKGFISNAQFAIGLAYVQNGQPVIGIVGMPNFPYQHQNPLTFNWQSNTPEVGSVCVGIKNDVRMVGGGGHCIESSII